MPKVSIVLPFRNAASTLPACLASIRRQHYTDFELLAIDDASSDASASLVRSFAEQDSRIRLLQPGRVGLVGALNLGIAAARGTLLARMDADDIMHPQRLAEQVSYLDTNPEAALVGCQVALFPPHRIQAGYREYIRWQNECLTPQQIADNIYVESPFAHPSVMLRREVVEHLGGYREGCFPEDYELWLRMHAAGFTMAKLPRVLLAWREWPERTSRVDPRCSREAFAALRARYLAQDPRLRQSRGFVIWGAGRKTRQRVRPLLETDLRPRAWIDLDPRKLGNRVWGLWVRPPDWLVQNGRPFVLVYVARHGAREDIAGRLASLGYQLGRDYLAVG